MTQATRRDVSPSMPVMQASGISLLRFMSMMFLIIALLAFLVMLLMGGSRLVRYTAIQAVHVEGDLRRVDQTELSRHIKPFITGNYFTVNVAAIRAAVDQVAWVDHVAVSRHWPNGVRITVRETRPVALWGAGGLISSRGALFVPTPQQGAGVNAAELPILFGPQGKTVYVMEQYQAMNAVLRSLGMRIVELQLTDRMSWFLRMDNGMSLVVDQVDTIAKMQRFAYLYERQLKDNVANIASVDLRYRNGVAVGWKARPNTAVKPA